MCKQKKKLIDLRTVGLVCMVLCIGFLFAGCSKTQIKSIEIPVVRTAVIKSGDAAQEMSYAGEVRGRFESQLGFQVGGRIINRYVQLGSVVEQGDVLMKIDAKDIQQGVTALDAQVSAAKSQLKLAQVEHVRYKKLFEQDIISKSQYDKATSQLEAAEAVMRQAEAQYGEGLHQLGYSSLRATANGVVSAIYAEAGQVVGAGQVVLTLVSGAEKEIEISVPEGRYDEVKKAETLRIKFWSLPDVDALGTVREISPIADPITRTYKVRIQLQDAPDKVRLGMTAKVFLAGKNNGAVYIPLTAVYQENGNPSVWIYTDNMVTRKNVKLGNFGDGKVQVVEGLREGDVIVTAGVTKLKEGQKVRTAEDGVK